MSVATEAGHSECLRAFAFSDPDGELWGAAWIPPASAGTAIISAGGRGASMPLETEGDQPSEAWGLQIGGSSLLVDGLGEPVGDAADAPTDFDQLCRVSGTLELDGQHREVSCLGWRGARAPGYLGTDVASMRQVAAWFGPDDGFALLALRPARAKGQEADTMSAAMFAPDASKAAAEARLSTSYADSGEPIRAGVELWLQAGDDPDQQYPRRAVGRATHPPVRWAVEGMVLEAHPFHWHAGGHEGPGIYLLGRRG